MPILANLPAADKQEHGQRETEATWLGSPCARQTCPWVTGRNPPHFQGLIIDMRHIHTWPRTSLVNRGGVPAGRARPAQQSPAHPTWCFSVQQPTFLPTPHEAGLEFMPGDRGTLGQGGCWVSQEHGLSNSCAAGLPPRHRRLRIPVRNADAEGSGREGAVSGLQPTAEPLKGPQEPTAACPPWAGVTAWRRAHRAAPAAAASSAHWSWTLALLALRDRCVPC